MTSQTSSWFPRSNALLLVTGRNALPFPPPPTTSSPPRLPWRRNSEVRGEEIMFWTVKSDTRRRLWAEVGERSSASASWSSWQPCCWVVVVTSQWSSSSCCLVTVTGSVMGSWFGAMGWGRMKKLSWKNFGKHHYILQLPFSNLFSTFNIKWISFELYYLPDIIS